MYHVYIVCNLASMLHSGVTNDPFFTFGGEGRTLAGRAFADGANQPDWFSSRTSSRVVYIEEFDDIDQAMTREKEIRRMTRRRKTRLIESVNPQWSDLSDGPEQIRLNRRNSR